MNEYTVLLSNEELMFLVPANSEAEAITYAPQAWARMHGEVVIAVSAQVAL